MTEVSSFHPRGAMIPRRARGRREAKIQFRNTPAYPGNSYPTSPGGSYPPSNDCTNLQTPQSPSLNINLSYHNLHHHPSIGSSNLSPLLHQNQNQNFFDETSSVFSFGSYTLATPPPNSPQATSSNHAQSPKSEAQATDTVLESWKPLSNHAGSDMNDVSMSDSALFGRGSFGDVEYSPSAGNSTASGGFAMPVWANFSPDGINPMYDLAFQNLMTFPTESQFGQSSPGVGDLSSPTSFSIPFLDDPQIPQNSYYGHTHAEQAGNWPAMTLTNPPHTQEEHGNAVPTSPWNPEAAQNSTFQVNAQSGVVAFDPDGGMPYDTSWVSRQYRLDNSQSITILEPASPAGESDKLSEGWAVISPCASSYAPSHGSPASHRFSPPRHDIEQDHKHIWDYRADISKPKASKGRQRSLTTQEKKEARDVREAKACWACHISKTKCSPCSPGSPCAQCDRLTGKRRFCKFDCFNDPLETLTPILVPSYHNGHFTKANVEAFVTSNASSWGSRLFKIRLDWGYHRLIEAEVATLTLLSNSSQMGFQHQTVSNGTSRPFLVRKQSPPLGIPLAAMDTLETTYAEYVQNIVRKDIPNYVSIAHFEVDSGVPKRLLAAVCSFYRAGYLAKAGSECDILRRAIEMHVNSVILERSLFLDAASLREVEPHLPQRYPDRSVSRLAQRQIKLAFFSIQRRCIDKVLKDWSSMMWSTNSTIAKDKDWAIAFSVFLMLILVMDKMVGCAYYFCEGRIVHYGAQAASERAQFLEVVRLTHSQLFDRCKEIFHWKFKTRKGGKEACNPIRDGIDAFQKGKAADKAVDPDVASLVGDLRAVVEEFDAEVRSSRSAKADPDPEYTNAGRLACVFLDDFLGR